MTTTIAKNNTATVMGGPTPENAPRVIIAEVRPHLSSGRYAIKRIVGERLLVTADIL